MTAFILDFSAFSTIASESYPQSAKRAPASIPSINFSAYPQSAAVPLVIRILTGIPCASTARCTLVLSPLLSCPYPDCRRERRFHVDELLHDLRQSSAVQIQDCQSAIPADVPRPPCRANGKNAYEYSSNLRSSAANHAKGRPFAISKIPHSQIADCLAHCLPRFPCDPATTTLFCPRLIRYIVPFVCIRHFSSPIV